MHRPRIIDGGLATTLEARGIPLHPRLWSAGVFLERPRAVEQVHREFLEAGADLLISASYQMSFAGLEREGLSHAAAATAMRGTVALARRAARDFDRRVLVAASVGTYGATLADGSEYRGDYDLDQSGLVEFHRERLDVLGKSGADLLAVETVPAAEEARAIGELLSEGEGIDAWVSFSCRDGGRLRDGTPIGDLARLLDDCPRVVALGINCTDPQHVASLIDALREGTSKRVVVYPNSGERWDAAARCWSGGFARARFLELAAGWVRQGVWAVGGCCRIGPSEIRELRGRFPKAG